MPQIHVRNLAVAGLLSVCAAIPAGAIEMFTYFGDGSRIGLPSLEVPVQAYPGIPLRSDRIRARSRAQQARRAVANPATPGPGADAPRMTPGSDGAVGIPGGGITIRPMPRQEGFGGVPAAQRGSVAPRAPASPSTTVTPQTRGGIVAPEAVAPPREAPLPGFSQPVFPSGR